jgi:hypothetical protein
MPTAATRSSGTWPGPESMNPVRPGPTNLQGLPTLTEVIESLPATRGVAYGSVSGGPVPVLHGLVRDAAAEAPAAPAASEQQLVERVLGDLQRHADLMLEVRLREVLAPALSRLADSLVSDVRLEFAATLRDLVERSVAQELARQRGG